MRSILLTVLLASFLYGCKSDTDIVEPKDPNVTERWKIAWEYELITECGDTATLVRPFASKFVVRGTSNVGLDRQGRFYSQSTVLDAVTSDSIVQCPTRPSIEIGAPSIARTSAPISAAVTGGFYPLGAATKDSVVMSINVTYLPAVVKYQKIKPLAITQYDTLGPGTLALNFTMTDVRDGGVMQKQLQVFTASSRAYGRATLTKQPL